MGVIRQRLATTRPGNCKLDEEKVLEIKRRLRDGETLVVIDEERRECDGDATDSAKTRKRSKDRKRNSAKRRIAKAIDQEMLVAHDKWVWLKEAERDECDG